MFKYKQVIVVRSDLNMSSGKLAVQVAHAAVGAANKTRRERSYWFRTWFSEGQKKVAVKVDDEGELRRIQKKVTEEGLPNSLVEDAGLTELPPGTTTVLGVGPAPNEIVDKITRNLPLL